MFDCIECKFKYAILTNNLCIFCNICKTNNKDDMFNIIICQTKLSQQEIIKRTYDYFIENNLIPTPLEIDKSCKTIKFNPYIFRENINISIQDYKIFFTNCIDRNKIKIKRLGSKYNIEKINIDKYYSSSYELKDVDEKTYNKLALILEL
jgi:hypothetical protein